MEQKHFFISADIEGITDVTFWSETENGREGYTEAAHQMTLETAAACRAILDAGHKVTVRDGHGSANNIEHRLLPKGTRLYRGWAGEAGSMLAGIDESYAGVLCIGYHAPAGAGGNPLAHTIDREAVRGVWIDGQLASEFTMNRLYAQSFGVPVLFISGDETICRMAALEVPQIVSVSVKTSRGTSACSLHPEDACEKIYQAVREMLENLFDDKGHCLVSAGTCKDTYQVKAALGVPGQQKHVLMNPNVKVLSETEVLYQAHSPSQINLFMDEVMNLKAEENGDEE